MRIFHDPSCAEYHRAGDPERPARITRTVPLLQERHPTWSWQAPDPARDRQLLRAHTRGHLQNVANPPGDFDTDTPAHTNVEKYARQSAGAAIGAALSGIGGQPAFSLMRPPGHHATRNRAMGFCYYSNIAIAALAALDSGVERVAIWDFDAHHGNGTEAVVLHNMRIAFASIHQSPGYPGTGLSSFENIDNYPIPPDSPRPEHLNALERSLEKLLLAKPQLLLVSAGFDAYAGDPITQMTLETEDFATMGRWVREAGVPAAAILEGGYSDDLPELIDAFLTAWAGQPPKLSAAT